MSHTPNQSRLHQSHEKRPKLRIPTAQIIGLNTTSSPTALPSNKRSPLKTSASEVTTPVHILSVSHLQTQKSTQISSMTKMASSPLKPPTITLTSNPASHQGSPTHNLSTFKGFPTRKSKEEISTWRPKKRRTEPNQLESPLTKGSRIEAASAGMKKRVVHSPTFHITTPEGMSPILTNPKSLLETFTEASPHKRISTKGSHQSQQKRSTMPYATIIKSPCARGAEEQHTDKQKILHNKAKEGLTRLIKESKVKKRSRSVHSLKQMSSVNSMVHLPEHSVMMSEFPLDVAKTDKNILRNYRHGSKPKELGYRRLGSGDKEKHSLYSLFTSKFYSKSMHPSGENSGAPTIESFPESMISDHHPLHHHPLQKSVRKLSPQLMKKDDGFVKQLSPFRSSRPAYDNYMWSPPKRTQRYEFGSPTVGGPKTVEVVLVGNEWKYAKDLGTSVENSLGELTAKHSGTGSRSNSNAGRTTKYNVDKSWTKLGRKSEEDYGGNIQKAKKGNIYIKEETTGYARGGSEYILARDIREEKKEVHVRRRKDEVHGYKGDSSSDIKEELEQAMLENERNRQKEQFLRDFRNKLKVEKGKYKLQQDSDYYNILADEQEEFEEEEILENSEVIERDQYVISEAGEMAEVKTEEEQYKERYRDDEGASRGIVQEKVPEKKKKAYRHVVDEEVEEHIVERIQDVRKISRVERKEEENKVEKEEKEPLEKIVEDDLMIQIERNIQRKVEQELKRRRESRSPVKSEQGSNMNFSVLSNLSKDEKKTIENKNSIVNTQNSVERVLKTEESQKHEGHPEFKLIQIVGANTSEVGLTERSAVGSEKKHKRKESYRQNRSGIKELGSTLPPKALQEYLQEEAYSNPRSTPQQEANNMENWSWKEEENRISEDFEGKRKSEPFISGMTKEELKKDDQRQPIKQVESGKGEKALANRSSEPEKKSIDLGVMIQERNVIGFKEIAKEHIEVKQKTAESEHVYKQGVKTEERRNIQKEEQNTLQVPEELPAILSSIKDIKQEGVSHEEGHAVKKTEQEKPKKIAYIVRDDIETVSTKEIPNEDPNKSVVDYKEDQNIRITDTAKIVTENKFIEEIEHRETISIQDKPKENLEQRQEGVSAKSIDKDVRDQDKPHKAPEEIGVVASVVPNEKEKSKEVESQKTTVHYQGNKINPIEKVEVVRNPKEAVSSIEAQEEIVEVKSIEKTEEGKVKKAQIVKEKTQKSGETNKKEEKIVQEANQQISQNVSSKEIKEQKQSVIQKKIEDISTELKKPEQVLTDEIKRETEKQNIVKGDQAVAATIESEGINQTATQELQQKIETSSVSDKKTHEKGQKAGPEVIKPTVTQSISKDAEEKKEEKLSEATPITVYKASEGVSEKALVEKIKKEEVKIDVNQERRKESTASVPEILKQTTEQKVLENENKIETSSMQDKKKGKTNLEIIEPANVPVANKNITENQGEKLVEASPINVQKSVEAVAEKAQVEEIKERDSKLDVNQERQKESAANVTEIVQQTTEQEVLENENEIETSPVSGKKKKKKSKKAKAETVESAQEKVEQDILGQKISDKGTESNQVERAKKEFIVEVKDTESKAQKTVNVNQARDVQSTNQKIIEVSKGNESETAKKQVINEKGERQINLGKTPQEIAGKVTIEEVKEQAVTKKDTENKLGTVAAQTASQDTKLNESEIVTSPVSQAKKNKGKKTQGENKEQIQEQTSKNVSSLEVQNKVEEIRQVNTGKEQRTSVEEIKQERVQETSKKSGQESPKTIVTQEIRIGDQEVKQSESEIETSPVSSKKMKTKKSQKAEPEVIKPTVTQTISKDTGKSQGEKLMEASPISVQKISEGVKEKVSVEEIKEEDVKSYVNQKRQKESASNLPEILQQAIEQEVLENENEIEISPVSGKKKKKKSKKAKAETVESVQGKINQETSGQEISNKGIEINQVESVKKEFAVEVKDTESKVQKTANVNVAKQAKDDAKQQDQKILDVNKGKESETPEKEVVDEKGERQINLEKTPQEIAGKVPIEEVKEQAVMKKDTTSKLETIAAQTAGQDTKLDESEIVTSPVSQVKKTKGTKVQGESQEKVQVHTPKNSILEVQNKAEEIRQVNTDKGQRTVVEEIKTEIIKESSKKTGAVSQEVKIVAQAENKTISDKIKKEEKAEPESIKSASVHATSKYTEENQGEKLVEASPINVQKISEGNEEKAYVEEIKKEDVKADVNQEKQKESAANIMDKLQTATEQEVPEDENEVEASPMSGKRKKKKSKTKAGSSAEQGVETLDNKRSIQPEPVTDKVSTEKVKAETDTNKKPEKESLSVESISKDTEKKLEKMEEVMKQVSPSILQKASERIEEKVLIEEIKEQPKSMEGVKQEKPKKAVLNRPDVSQEVSAQANQKDNEMKKSDTVELVTEQEIPENEDEIESSPVSGKKKKKRSKKAKAGTSEQQIIDPLEVKTSIQPQPAVDKVSTGKIQEEEIKVDVKQERQKEYAASVSETLQQATKQEALGNEIGIETIPVSEKKSKDKKAKVEAEAETDKDSSTNITKESKNEDLTIQSLSAEKRIQEKQDIVKEESSSRLQKVPERSEEKAHIEEIKEESNQGKLKGAILTQPDISHEMNTQANQKDNEMKNSDIAEHEVPENENEIETSPVSGKKRKNRSKKARAGISEEQTVEPLEVKSSIKHEAVAEKISVDEIKEQNTNKQELSKEKESLRVESRSKNTEKNNEKKQEVITEVSSSILQKEPGSEEKVRIEEIKVGVKKEKLKETPVAKPEMSQEVDVQATQKDNEMNKPDIVELITEQEVPENENEIETSPVSGKKKKNWSKKAKAGTSEDQMVEPLEVKSSIKPEAVIENVSVEENKEQNINKQELEKEKEKESVIDKQEMSQQVTEQEAPENENEIEVSPLSGKKKKKKGKKSQAEVDTCITKEQAKESLIVESISKEIEKNIEMKQEVIREISSSILQNVPERIEEKVHIEEIKEDVKREKSKEIAGTKPEISQEVFAQANQKDNELKMPDTGIAEVVMEQEVPENENEIETSPVSGKRKKNKSKKAKTGINKEQVVVTLEVKSSIKPETVAEKISVEEIKEQNISKQDLEKEKVIEANKLEIQHQTIEQETPENENEVEASPVSGKKKKKKNKKAKPETGADTSKGPEKETLVLESLNKEAEGSIVNIQSEAPKETSSVLQKAPEISEEKINIKEHDKEIKEEKQGTTTSEPETVQKMTIQDAKEEEENEIETTPVSGKKKKNKSKKTKAETNINTNKEPEQEGLTIRSIKKDAEKIIEKEQEVIKPESSSTLQKAPERIEEKANIEEIKEHDKVKEGVSEENQETAAIDQDVKEKENEVEASPVSGKNKKKKGKKAKAEADIGAGKETEKASLTIESISKDTDKRVEKKQEVIKEESSSTLQKSPERSEEKVGIEEIKEQDKTQEDFKERKYQEAAVTEPEIIEHVTAQNPKEEENEIETSPVSGKKKKKKGIKTKAEADIGANKEPEKEGLTIESISKDTDKSVEKKQEVIKEESSSTLQKAPERSEEKVSIKEQDNVQEDGKKEKQHSAIVTAPEIIQQVTARDIQQKENEAEVSRVSDKKKKKKDKKGKAEVQEDATEKKADQILNVPSLSKPEEIVEKVTIEEIKEEKENVTSKPELPLQIAGQRVQENENEIDTSPVSGNKKKRKGKKAKPETGADTKEELEKKGLVPESLIKDIEIGLEKNQAEILKEVPSSTIQQAPERAKEKVQIEEIKEQSKAQEDLKERKHQETVVIGAEIPEHVTAQEAKKENDIETTPISGNKKEGKKAQVETIEEVIRISTKETEITQGENIVKEEIKVRKDVEEKMHKTVHTTKEDEHTLKQQEVGSQEGIESKKQAHLSTIEAPAKQVVIEEIKEQDKGGVFEAKQEVNISSHQEVSQPVANEEVQLDRGESPVSDDKRKNKETVAKKGVQEDIKVQKEKVSNIEPQKEVEHVVDVTVKEEVQEKKDGLKVEEAQKELHVQKPREVQKEKQRAHDGQNSELKNILKAEEKPRVEEPTKIEAKISESKEAENVPERIEIPKNITVESASKDSLPTISNRLEVQTQKQLNVESESLQNVVEESLEKGKELSNKVNLSEDKKEEMKKEENIKETERVQEEIVMNTVITKIENAVEQTQEERQETKKLEKPNEEEPKIKVSHPEDNKEEPQKPKEESIEVLRKEEEKQKQTEFECNEPIPDQTIKTIKRNVEEQRAQDTEEKSKKILEEESEIEESIRESESKTVEKEYPLIVVREETSFQTRTYEGHEHSHELTRPGAVLHKSIFSTCNSRSQLFEEEENSEEKATNLEGTHIETIASQEILPEEKRVQNVRNQQETKIHQTEVHITHEKAVEEHKEEPKAPEWKERETEKVHEKPVENQEKKAKAFPRRFYGFDYSGLVNVNLNNSNSSKTIEESPRLTTSQTIKLSDLDNKSVSAIHLHRIDTQESDNLPSDLMRSNWLLHGLKDSAHGEEEKHEHGRSSFVNSAQNSARNSGGNQLNTSFESLKRSTESPGRKEPVETDWRTLAMKQSHLMRVSFSPTFSPSAEAREHRDDPVTHLSAMYENNISKVETLKRLDNKEGAIQLMRDIIAELDTHKEKHGELEPDEANTVMLYKIHAHNRLALELYEHGEYNEVLLECKKVIDMDKSNLQALYKAYQANIKLNNKDKTKLILTRIRKLMQMPMVLQYNKQFLLDNLSLPTQSNSQLSEDMHDSRLSHFSLGS